MVVIRDWQRGLDGCPSASCAFIQMHGKASTTCPNDTVFLSSGLGIYLHFFLPEMVQYLTNRSLGNANSSILWYQDSVDRPVKRIKSKLKLAFPGWPGAVSLPSDSGCDLTATRNVGGRHINNVPLTSVCTVGATPSGATGQFVHIEQASEARLAANYALWSQAELDSFAPAAA